MSRTHSFIKASICSLASVFLLFNFSESTLALSDEELRSKVNGVTVRILERKCNPPEFPDSEPTCWDDPTGTGTIIARSSNTYYVLTARHVVDNNTGYKVLTSDQKIRAADAGKVVISENDLAVIAFTDRNVYDIATMYKGCFLNRSLTRATELSFDAVFCHSNSGVPVNLPLVLVAGYPIGSDSLKLSVGSFIDRNPTSLEAQIPYTRGYEFLYTNETDRGMSGGPIWDANGQLIGVHGQSEKDVFSGIPFGYSVGIPIDLFFRELDETFSDGIFSGSARNLDISVSDISPFPFSQESINHFSEEISYSCLSSGDNIDATANSTIRIIEATNRLYRIGQYSEALDCLNRAQVVDRSSPSILFAKGFLLMKMDRLSESLEALNATAQVSEDYSDAYVVWRWRGVVLNRLTLYDDALSSFARAAELYRGQTNEIYPQAWASIFSTIHDLSDAMNSEAIDWDTYSTWNSKGDKLLSLDLYKPAIEAYRSSQHFNGVDDHSAWGELQSLIALSNQNPSLEILARSSSVSHVDPVWYYSYIFKHLQDVIQSDKETGELSQTLDSTWDRLIAEWEGASSPVSYASSAFTDSFSVRLDPSSVTELPTVNISSLETNSESIDVSYRTLYEMVEELKVRNLNVQAFHLCSLSAAFYFDMQQHNAVLRQMGRESMLPTTPIYVSCSHNGSFLSTNRDIDLSTDGDALTQDTIVINVDTAKPELIRFGYEIERF